MSFSTLSDNTSLLKIGNFFTPTKWGEFAVEEFGLFEKWIAGQTVFDPTMGEGYLLESLISYGLKRGYDLQQLPIHNLFGAELNESYFNNFLVRVKNRYGSLIQRENYQNEDIFFQKEERKFDILLGNPPWKNFVDLPEGYKQTIKPKFFEYDLVANPKDLLLGFSRIDIASLVIRKTIAKNLRKGGKATFFIPLSLLLNDGANRSFRSYKVNGNNYRIDLIFDFNTLDIFHVATRYGLVHISRDEKQEFPIRYKRWEDGSWKSYYAKPLLSKEDPLSVLEEGENNILEEFQPIIVPKSSTPRQGINTCGANHVFFFTDANFSNEKYVVVGNRKRKVQLPREFIYPLVTSTNFFEDRPLPKKWVLLPYNSNAQPLELSQIKMRPLLWNYLQSNKEILYNRKGTLINRWIHRGYWWALFGVGEYCFAPYKVIWQAYGKNDFSPKLFSGEWQANQSLQAFMPVKTRNEGHQFIRQLGHQIVKNYLLSLKMEGTMNWAQPGRIKKLLKLEETTPTLL